MNIVLTCVLTGCILAGISAGDTADDGSSSLADCWLTCIPVDIAKGLSTEQYCEHYRIYSECVYTTLACQDQIEVLQSGRSIIEETCYAVDSPSTDQHGSYADCTAACPTDGELDAIGGSKAKSCEVYLNYFECIESTSACQDYRDDLLTAKPSMELACSYADDNGDYFDHDFGDAISPTCLSKCRVNDVLSDSTLQHICESIEIYSKCMATEQSCAEYREYILADKSRVDSACAAYYNGHTNFRRGGADANKSTWMALLLFVLAAMQLMH